ncbi:MAG: phenylacetate--CoA ligase family protein [Limisphaerales bacterium]
MAASFLTREQIREQQLAQLNGLLQALVPTNAFYNRKLSTLQGRALASLEQFAECVPFTRKHELADDQRNHPPFGSNLTFPLEHYTRFHQTSGTSGTPIRWLDTPQSWQWMVGSWKEVLRAAGVGGSDRVYFAFSFGPFIGFWLAFEAAAQLGCLCIPGGGLGSEARLRAILENGANVLCCTPTYALRLAEVAAEIGIDLQTAKIKTLLVAGEPGGSIPSTRQRLERIWPGVRVFDHHGMTEVGPVTYECPAQPGTLHVIETAYLAEVISADGSPVPQGENGELVLTTLGRTGSPLLRYRTGDLVKPGAPGKCQCGRHELRLEGGILGRVDDMVIVRGVNIYPSAIEEILRSFDQIAEYRVHLIQTADLPELSIELEATEKCADDRLLSRAVEKKLQSALSLRVPVRCVARGSLPRFEMKAKRWVRASAGNS